MMFAHLFIIKCWNLLYSVIHTNAARHVWIYLVNLLYSTEMQKFFPFVKVRYFLWNISFHHLDKHLIILFVVVFVEMMVYIHGLKVNHCSKSSYFLVSGICYCLNEWALRFFLFLQITNFFLLSVLWFHALSDSNPFQRYQSIVSQFHSHPRQGLHHDQQGKWLQLSFYHGNSIQNWEYCWPFFKT